MCYPEGMGQHLVWNVSPDIFQIGSFSLRWYGVLFATGFYIGLQIINAIAKREKLQPPVFDSLLIYSIVGTVVGARLGHVIFYEPAAFLSDPLRVIRVWEGGLASHGGVIGVIAGIAIWGRRHFRGSILLLLDYMSVPSEFVGGMIRIANFFNSEILGKPSDQPWAIVFKRVDELPRHPAMLYEAFAYFTIFAVGMMFLKRGIHKRFGEGFLTGYFFVAVFSARFLIEFVKELQVPEEAALPMDLGQLLSIPFVLLGIGLIVRAVRRGKPNG